MKPQLLFVLLLLMLFVAGCSSTLECVDDGICTPSELLIRCNDCLPEFSISPDASAQVIGDMVELRIPIVNNGFEYLGNIPYTIGYMTSDGRATMSASVSLLANYHIEGESASGILASLLEQAQSSQRSTTLHVQLHNHPGLDTIQVAINPEQTIQERDGAYDNNVATLIVSQPSAVHDSITHRLAIEWEDAHLVYAYDWELEDGLILSVLDYNVSGDFIRVMHASPDTQERLQDIFESDIFTSELVVFDDYVIADVTAVQHPESSYYIWFSESTQSTLFLQKSCRFECFVPDGFLEAHLNIYPSSVDETFNERTSFSSLADALPNQDRQTFALSWHDDVPEWTKDRIVQTVWVTDGRWRFGMDNVTRMVDLLAERPHGAKAIFFHGSAQNMIFNHPDDAIEYITENGTVMTFNGVFLEHGTELGRQMYHDVYRQLYERGAELEFIVMDYEEGKSNWHIKGEVEQYRAIEQHPRFETFILPRIIDHGFNTSYGLMDSVRLWKTNPNYHPWNIWRAVYQAEALTKAVCEPAYEFFPDVTCSNFGYYALHPSLEVPHNSGQEDYKFGTDFSVGTHQSGAFYGGIGNLRHTRLPHFQRTPFNSFRYYVNWGRMMFLASPKPLQPWVACRDWKNHEPNTVLTHTDYWQEMLIHLLMTRTEEFLYWNLTQTNSCEDENEIYMHRTLTEFDEVVRTRDVTWTVEELTPWDKPFVYSSVIVQGDIPLRITRFTANTPLRVSSGLSENVAVDDSSITIIVDGHTVTFYGAELYEPSDPVSVYGLWIIQRTDAETVVS